MKGFIEVTIINSSDRIEYSEHRKLTVNLNAIDSFIYAYPGSEIFISGRLYKIEETPDEIKQKIKESTQ